MKDEKREERGKRVEEGERGVIEKRRRHEEEKHGRKERIEKR